ncbi:hypothetical protein LEP1GSC168_0109 [Leptospira santarosai str. HAI134]|nr:hypothetical protein LEP1GSC168_0109 [Leptospira santarosai str. HAI134]
MEKNRNERIFLIFSLGLVIFSGWRYTDIDLGGYPQNKS